MSERVMGVWLKVGGALIAAVVLFVSGYKYASALYEADIADIQTQHALALKEKTDEYRSKEQSQAKQLADAWDALERARAESIDLRADVDRVRNEADRYLSRLSSADRKSSSSSYQTQVFTCTRLLKESAELLEEGGRMAQEFAIGGETVVRLLE
ncbi:DUF2514 family protein [Sutterella sp. AM11-39]|uniref:DUF2514 family protein n=1 Tax=Sutterella sp. AM11-39 TaxID=2292075 RepID=UPI0011C46253|nr:DUF2514 family protein [Sutterella sp. AM11-39]